MDLLSGLNEPQREAVLHTNGPLLIFAGAGSGKTRTLTHRIAHLIGSGVPAPRILAVTFTNKAAREMRERLEKLIGRDAGRMWLGTFHALCAQMLRMNGGLIGLDSRFVIFDSDDASRVMKDVLKEANLDSDKYPPSRILGRVSDAKNNLLTPDEFASQSTGPYDRAVARLYARYQERLRESHALDFDDLIMEGVRLLRDHADAREHWSDRFQHVLVDEFQDVNAAQFKWVQLLAEKHRNICVVGDDDQCLPPGTLVATPNGEVAIENVIAGDQVLGGIGECFAHHHRVEFVNAAHYQGPMLRITLDSDQQLRVTPNHICFAQRQSESRKDLVTLTAFSNLDYHYGVLYHKVEDEYLTCFDAAEAAVKRASSHRGGAEIERFARFSDDFKFVTASSLTLGDVVPVVNERTVDGAVVKSIEMESYDGPVYDLDVPKIRNYAANGVLVHNSIYGWRGANVRLILEFELSYADAKIVRLEQNYRSTQNILDAAHGVISKNRSRAPKKLWTQDDGGAQLVLHGAANAQEEAKWVVDSVQQMKREGREPSEIALLCRVNAQSRPFEEAFIRARLPLRLIGTQRFYERREIKDLIAYLKLLYNPNDALSLRRIVNVPARGIGATTLDKLQGRADEQSRALYDVVLDPETPAWLGRPAGPKIQNFARLLEQLNQDADNNQTLGELLSMIIERTDYMEFLRREKTLDSIDRVANVEEFLSSADDFDERFSSEPVESDDDITNGNEAATPPDISLELPQTARARLGTFLETVALEGGGDAGDESGNAVSFMTLHSAKGLEFPVVFLVGLEQGLLPHGRALWGESANDSELEEERRLCYVGLTRAREQVYLSYAIQRTMHGRTESSQPSQFLDEIPPHLLDRAGYARLNAPRLTNYATRWDSPGSPFRPDVPSKPDVPSAVAATREASVALFAIGDRVSHPTWGEGVVTGGHGTGRAEVVEVAFLSRDAGKKRLAASHAKLEKL